MNGRKKFYESGMTRLLDREELQRYLGMGKNSAVRFAEECGAKRKFGKISRFDREVIDAALDELMTARKPVSGND